MSCISPQYECFYQGLKNVQEDFAGPVRTTGGEDVIASMAKRRKQEKLRKEQRDKAAQQKERKREERRKAKEVQGAKVDARAEGAVDDETRSSGKPGDDKKVQHEFFKACGNCAMRRYVLLLYYYCTCELSPRPLLFCSIFKRRICCAIGGVQEVPELRVCEHEVELLLTSLICKAAPKCARHTL